MFLVILQSLVVWFQWYSSSWKIRDKLGHLRENNRRKKTSFEERKRYFYVINWRKPLIVPPTRPSGVCWLNCGFLGGRWTLQVTRTRAASSAEVAGALRSPPVAPPQRREIWNFFPTRIFYKFVDTCVCSPYWGCQLSRVLVQAVQSRQGSTWLTPIVE